MHELQTSLDGRKRVRMASGRAMIQPEDLLRSSLDSVPLARVR